MGQLKWDDSNNVGNGVIDIQHREWVELFNRLEKSCVSDTVESQNDKVQILKELVDFTYAHFKFEERELGKIGYAGLAQHRKMHKNFHQEVYDIYREVLGGKRVLNSTILNKIKNWFVSHTTTEDQKAFSSQ